jgi:tRNA(His) 5'-end guanylyltransferase
MLFQKKNVNFNDYPARFKRGQFFIKRKVHKELDKETLEKIPVVLRPSGPIERNEISQISMPKFSSVHNRISVLFDGYDPIVSSPIVYE